MQISVCCDKLVTAEKKVPTSYGSPNEGVTFTRISRDQNSSPLRTPDTASTLSSTTESTPNWRGSSDNTALRSGVW